MGIVDLWEEHSLLIGVGLSCAVAQVVLWLLFSYALGDGPWRAEPGFTAHQVICMPLMIYMTYAGWSCWLSPDTCPLGATPEARVLEAHPVGYAMSQIVVGELLFWDIPTGLLVKSLREPLMVAHHIGMVLVGGLGLYPLWSSYAVTFFGVIEVSGIFLCIVDVFHPKHTEWVAYLSTAPALSALNDAARLVFVALYFCVRAVLFPYVVFSQVLPDAYALLDLPPARLKGVDPNWLLITPVFGVLFSLLQLYWAVLLGRQVQKVLGGGKKDTGKAA